MLRRRAINQLDAANPQAHGILDRLEYADAALSAGKFQPSLAIEALHD